MRRPGAPTPPAWEHAPSGSTTPSAGWNPGSAASGRRAAHRPIPTISAEWLHALATKVMDSATDWAPCVAIATGQRREGATTILCNLAACLAEQMSKRVVVVDANLRNPALHAVYGLPRQPGLTEVLSHRAGLHEALYARREGGVFVMPGGEAELGEGGPGAVLASERITDLVAQLRELSDVVLFDTAPLRLYPDTSALARHLDGLVLVLEAERSRWDAAEQTGTGVARQPHRAVGGGAEPHSARRPRPLLTMPGAR